MLPGGIFRCLQVKARNLVDSAQLYCTKHGENWQAKQQGHKHTWALKHQ